MNSSPKRGKYSLAEADEEQQCSTTTKSEDGWKQCQYVSNRTHLRCQNIRKADHLKDYGFCEQHFGYIERIRNEGLRTKHIFDPSISISQSFMELISDEDETLEPHFSADFPFVYESLYCDSRYDNDDNPLRRAKVYTKKEIIREYIRALRRQHQSIQEIRTVYHEKYLRVLQQISRLANQSNQILLDPIKDAEKIQRMAAFRRSALNYEKQRIMRQKFLRMENNKQGQQMTERTSKDFICPEMFLMFTDPVVENNHDATDSAESSDKQESEISSDDTMVCARINKPWNGTTKTPSLRESPSFTLNASSSTGNKDQGDLDVINPEMYLIYTNYPVENNHNATDGVGSSIKQKPLISDNTMVCARINQPWKGTRKHVPPLRNSPSFTFTTTTSSPSVTSKSPYQHHLIRNNGFSLPTQPSQSKQPYLIVTPKIASNTGSNSGSSSSTANTGTYQQYLSQQRLIPAILQNSTVRRHYGIPLIRQRICGQQKSNTYKYNT